MLTIEPIGSSAEQVRYYAQLGRGDHRHEYYSEGRRPGRWWGKGAEKLGLTGDVSEDVFKRVLQGKSIDGAQILIRPPADPTKERRSGWDLTWSAPKSVSCAWSQGDEQLRAEIVSRCERALEKSLELFDELCSVTRRGHGGSRQERAGLVAALFRHDTARPVSGDVPGEIQKPDPNLHWHLVLANYTTRGDGSVGAFFGGEMYRRGMKLALGTLFRVAVAQEMRAMGLESYRPEKEGGRGEKARHFELTAVPKKLLEEMSKRRRAIEKWLQKNGLSGWRASQKGTLATREKKAAFTQAELDSEWRAQGAKHGFTLETLLKAKKHLEPVNREEESKHALQNAVQQLSREKSRFSWLELLRVTAEHAQTRGLSISDVRHVVRDALTHSPELVRLKEVDGERNWTTRENLEIEKRMLRTAARLNKRTAHAASYRSVAEVLQDYPTMREEQRAALRHMCAGSDLAVVNGISGSGKSYALKAAKEVWQKQGYSVIGTALAANTAERLEEDSGIQSIYCHKLLQAIEVGKVKIDESNILLVEEAGMISTRLMDRLIQLAEEGGGKIVLSGDVTQLAPIEAGAPMAAIGLREGMAELNEIIRQKRPADRQLVRDLRAGRAGKVILDLFQRDLLHVARCRDDAIDRLASDWAERAIRKGALWDSAILVGKNMDAREVNAKCQAARLNAGELSREKLAVGDYDFYVGDIVQATRNYHPLLIRNGMRGTVTAVVDQHTVRVRFQDGWQVDVDASEYEHLSLGYAQTVHKLQGASVAYSYYLLDETMTDRESAYVGGSRHKDEARFYTDQVTGAENLQQAARLLERSRAHDLAVEHELPEQTLEMG
ncbi:relaxase domain-containing protein [Pirellulales bacterium]|nr:relaxase domain-containing protein [Pirellulales bacterium]